MWWWAIKSPTVQWRSGRLCDRCVGEAHYGRGTMQTAPPPRLPPVLCPVAVIEPLLAALGLAERIFSAPLRDRWGAPRERAELSPAQLLRLGQLLVALRPARHGDVLAVWQRLGVPLHLLRVHTMDLQVLEGGHAGLQVELGGLRGGAAEALQADSPLLDALRARMREARFPEAVVLRARLDGLSAAGFAEADALPWERLLAPFSPGTAHVLRCVASRRGPEPPKVLRRVRFVQDPALPTAAGERALLQTCWPHGWVGEDADADADVVHVVAHGSGGGLRGLHPGPIGASVVVCNSCEAALPGGLVGAMVSSGQTADGFGFAGRVLAETGKILTAALHAGLYTWRADGPQGVVQAALKGREAMGNRTDAASWRHYRAMAAPSSSSLDGEPPGAGRNDAIDVASGPV